MLKYKPHSCMEKFYLGTHSQIDLLHGHGVTGNISPAGTFLFIFGDNMCHYLPQ